MTYYIADEKRFDTASELADYITANLGGEGYDEALDELYGNIDICGYQYSASRAFEKVNPIAYGCRMMDYYSSIAQDITYELERMRTGEHSKFHGIEVYCLEEDTE